MTGIRGSIGCLIWIRGGNGCWVGREWLLARLSSGMVVESIPSDRLSYSLQ